MAQFTTNLVFRNVFDLDTSKPALARALVYAITYGAAPTREITITDDARIICVYTGPLFVMVGTPDPTTGIYEFRS